MKRVITFLKHNKVMMYIILFFMIFAVHQFIFMYHDDYGYVSLTYGVSSINDQGMDYPFYKIFEYLSWHYNNWGGRVVGFFLSISLLKLGLGWYQFAQSIVVFAVLCLIYKHFSLTSGKSLYKLIAISGLFFLIPITITNESLYWATASVLYFWPFLYFFAGLNIAENKKISNVFKITLLVICGVLAGWSQEQMGAAFICYLLLTVVIDRVCNKSFNAMKIVFLLSTTVGFVLLMVAPGNYVRLDDPSSSILAGKSTVDILLMNIPVLLQKLEMLNNTLIYQIFLIFMLLAVFMIRLGRSKKAMLICTIIAASSHLLILSYDITLYPTLIKYILLCIHICSVISMLYLLSREKNEYGVIVVYISGLVSLLPMLIAPYFPDRSLLPVLMFIIICTFIVLQKSFEFLDKNVVKVVIWVLAILSVMNYLYVLIGYIDNSMANRENNKILRNASIEIENGAELSSILLYKNANERFTGAPPYLVTYTQYWIKDYYSIPDSVNLVYLDGLTTSVIGDNYYFGTTSENSSDKYFEGLSEGWGSKEAWGIWSIDSHAKLYMNISEKTESDLIMTLSMKAYALEDYQNVTVYVNNSKVSDLSVKTDQLNEYKVLIPKELYNKNSTMEVEFVIENPVSPFTRGESEDTRMLGIGLVSLQLNNN